MIMMSLSSLDISQVQTFAVHNAIATKAPMAKTILLLRTKFWMGWTWAELVAGIPSKTLGMRDFLQWNTMRVLARKVARCTAILIWVMRDLLPKKIYRATDV